MMQTEQICNHTAVMYATGSRAEGGDNSNEHNAQKHSNYNINQSQGYK